MENFKLFRMGKEVCYYIGDKGTLKTFRYKTMEFNTLTPSASITCRHDTKGYLQTTINIDGKNKVFRVHRLVAENFVKGRGKPKEQKEVNHKNGDKHDNRKENLEWVKRSYNTKHAHENGLIKKNYDGLIKYNEDRRNNLAARAFAKHGKEKLCLAIAMVRSGETCKTAEETTGISRKVIWHYSKRSKALGL